MQPKTARIPHMAASLFVQDSVCVDRQWRREREREREWRLGLGRESVGFCGIILYHSR